MAALNLSLAKVAVCLADTMPARRGQEADGYSLRAGEKEKVRKLKINHTTRF